LGGAWLWERYGVDFIKEDGVWKFWHILVLTDFMSEMGKPLAGVTDAPIGPEASQAQGGSPWDVVATDPYKAWGPNVAQQIAPRLPEPYQTFAETFSYGPPKAN
jgi:hypothetical protein